MSTNGVNITEDADMSEYDGEKVVTMMDVLQEQQEFEEDANAVLGASDEKNCTYSKGYIKRQAIYACMTCCVEAKDDPTKRAGVCLACSLNCHENHELIELYTKRNFRCDCGNPKFNSNPCHFTPNKTDLNEDNVYNQNFSGLYCTCHRPYPDPESPIEDEMIQCIICEDWLHASHLEATVPANEQYSEMICRVCMEHNEFLHDYSNFAVNIETGEVDVLTINGTDPGKDKLTKRDDEALSEPPKETDANSMNIETAEAKAEINGDSDKLVGIIEKETTKGENEEVIQTEVIQVSSTKDNKNDSGLGNMDAKELDDAKVALKDHEDAKTHKEYTNLPMEEEDLKKTEESFKSNVDTTENAKLNEKSTTEELHIVKTSEKMVTEGTFNDTLESETLPKITDEVAKEDNKEVDKLEPSTHENTEPISEVKLDTSPVIEESYKTIETKKTTVTEGNINKECLSEELKIDKEDIQVDKTEQSYESTESVPPEKDQAGTDHADKSTSEVEKLLEDTVNDEDNVEKSLANSSDTVPETKCTEENANLEENSMDANKPEKDSVDVQLPSTTDKTEEPIVDFKSDDAIPETIEKTQDSEIMNDKDSFENKTNDVSHDIEVNEGNVKILSDKTEDTEMDDITNKTDNSNIETTTTNETDLIRTTETDFKNGENKDNINKIVPTDSENSVCNDTVSENKCTSVTSDIEMNVDSTNLTETANIENKVPNETEPNAEDNIKENKRKLSTEDAQEILVKKQKLEETKKCVRPQGVKRLFKGATFWPLYFRQKLCTCNGCISMYKDLAVLYLIDPEDTVSAYETLGKEKINGGPASQYEKGLQALSSLDRIQQINALTEYNKMRDKLLDFLKSFKDRKEIVKEEDIKAFFAGMKPKREPDGVYFCR